MDKYHQKIKRVNQFLATCTILCLQETHDDGDSDIQYLEGIRGRDFCFFRSILTTAAGGILTCIRKDYIKLFETTSTFEILGGRAFAVILHSSILTMIIINVHLHGFPNNDDEKIKILRKVHAFIQRHPGKFIYLVGDWNFVSHTDDRVNLSNGETCGRYCKVAEYWDNHFEQFSELYQSNHTRYPSEVNDNRTSARLDRLYGNFKDEHWEILEVHTATRSKTPDFFLSDHCAVGSTIGVRAKNATQSYPEYIIKGPEVPRSGMTLLYGGPFQLGAQGSV